MTMMMITFSLGLKLRLVARPSSLVALNFGRGERWVGCCWSGWLVTRRISTPPPPPPTTTSYCQLQHQEDISSTTLGSDKAWDPSGWQGRPGGLPPPIAERMRELKICCDSSMESTEERRNMCTESLNLNTLKPNEFWKASNGHKPWLYYYLSQSSLALLMTKNFNNLGWEFEMKICRSNISEIYN